MDLIPLNSKSFSDGTLTPRTFSDRTLTPRTFSDRTLTPSTPQYPSGMTEQRLQLQDQMNEQFRQSLAEIQRRSMVENEIQQQLMAERARLEEMADERNFLSKSERQRRTIQAQYIEDFLRDYPLMSSPSEQKLILRDFLNYIHNRQPEEIERKMAEKIEIDQLINAKRVDLEEMAGERNFNSHRERQRRTNQNEYLRSVFPLSRGGSRKKRNTRKRGKGCSKGKKKSSKNRKGCSRRRSKKSRK